MAFTFNLAPLFRRPALGEAAGFRRPATPPTPPLLYTVRIAAISPDGQRFAFEDELTDPRAAHLLTQAGYRVECVTVLSTRPVPPPTPPPTPKRDPKAPRLVRKSPCR